MAQIKFSVGSNTERYLAWYSRTFLADGSPHVAARHLFMRGLEASRRANTAEEFDDFGTEEDLE